MSDIFNPPADLEPLTLAKSSSINDIVAAVKAAFDQLPDLSDLKVGSSDYAVSSSGTANAYSVTMKDATVNYYQDGSQVIFKPVASNTGASSINVNSMGYKPIVLITGAQISPDDLIANAPIALRYSTNIIPGGAFVVSPNLTSYRGELDGLTDVVITTPSNGQVLRYDAATDTWKNQDNTQATTAGINDLSDVVISSPSTNQVIKYNGTNWVNDTVAGGGGGATDLNGLTDVEIFAPVENSILLYTSNLGGRWYNDVLNLNTLPDVTLSALSTGHVLKYNGSQWVNDTIPGASNLDSLTDVTITTPISGQRLAYNGSQWVNANALSADDLVDVTITTPTSGQVLKYNGSQWVNDTVAGGGATNLDGLTDVVITTASTNQTLKFNGTNWVNSNSVFASGNSVDVYISGTPSEGQVLKYTTTGGGYWYNTNHDLGNLGSVNISAPALYQTLTYNGTQWVNGSTITNHKFKNYSEIIAAPSISGSSLTLDLSTGNVFSVAHTANISTITISNPPASGAASFTLQLEQDGMGGKSVTFPPSVKWFQNTTPTIQTTASVKNIFTFVSFNQGTTWTGTYCGWSA